MNVVIDETDKFTGHRSVQAILQDQNRSQPFMKFTALLFGDSEPMIAGTGSFQIQFGWIDLGRFQELDHVRQIAEQNGLLNKSDFCWLIDGKPEKIGAKHHIIKTASSDSVPESLCLFVNFTMDELRRIAFAEAVDCRLDLLEFEIGGAARSLLAQSISKIGDVKTLERVHEQKLEIIGQKLPMQWSDSVALENRSASNFGSLVLVAILVVISLFFLSRCSSGGTNARDAGLPSKPNSAALSGKTYTPAELRSMVASGKFPNQETPSTQKQSMPFLSCVQKVKGVLDSVESQYPADVAVDSGVMYLAKVWTNDAAMTLTCSAPDGALVITTAKYR